MTVTTPTKQQTWLLGVLTAVFIAILIPAITGGAQNVWDAKLPTERYERDRQRDSLEQRRHYQLDSLQHAELRELQLDVLCSPNVRPSARQCRGNR